MVQRRWFAVVSVILGCSLAYFFTDAQTTPAIVLLEDEDDPLTLIPLDPLEKLELSYDMVNIYNWYYSGSNRTAVLTDIYNVTCLASVNYDEEICLIDVQMASTDCHKNVSTDLNGFAWYDWYYDYNYYYGRKKRKASNTKAKKQKTTTTKAPKTTKTKTTKTKTTKTKTTTTKKPAKTKKTKKGETVAPVTQSPVFDVDNECNPARGLENEDPYGVRITIAWEGYTTNLTIIVGEHKQKIYYDYIEAWAGSG